MTIEQRLRDIRTERGLSQEALAELVNVSRQTVSRWENGAAHPSGDNLAALSRVFDLPLDALVKDNWTPPQELDPVIVEAPVEVPRPGNYRLWAVIAAVLIAAGITIGALFFRKSPDASVSISELESEVIDVSAIEAIELLPPWDTES